MSIEEFPRRGPAIQTQRGRKTRKIGGTLQRIWTSHRIGPPPPAPLRTGGKPRNAAEGKRRATTPTLSVPVRRNCRWHSECRNGTPRRSGVGSFQPYETRLCDTFGQCQNGTKTMTQKLPLCAKSWHSFMTM